jgi:hypothetical protein
LSDLANSCEYLTSEKLCLAVIESEKAKASRQVRCKNDEKMTCCYLCMFVMDCATPCHFLGNSENEPQQVEHEKTPVSSTVINEQKIGEDETLYSSVTCCSLCNVEMFQTRTKFTIDGWKRSPQISVDDDEGKIGVDELPVTIYMCPKCGKIDFRADEKINNK